MSLSISSTRRIAPAKLGQAHPTARASIEQVAAHQNAGRRALDPDFGRSLPVVLSDRDRRRIHQGSAQPFGRTVGMLGVAPLHAWTVDASHPAALPERKVQDGDVAESDQGFRVPPGRVEVEPVGDAIGALAAASGEDRSNGGISERLVDVLEPVLVASGEIVAHAIERMGSDLDAEAPLGEDLGPARNERPVWGAGWRDKPYAVAAPEPGWHGGLLRFHRLSEPRVSHITSGRESGRRSSGLAAPQKSDDLSGSGATARVSVRAAGVFGEGGHESSMSMQVFRRTTTRSRQGNVII
jgi:hypothetical protein